MFPVSKELFVTVGVVIALLGLIYMFREISKLKKLVVVSPKSVAPVREAPLKSAIRKSVYQQPPPTRSVVIDEEDDDEESED